MSEKLVTIARFSYEREARDAKQALASAGITAWFTDGELVQSEWFSSDAADGMKLQVASGDEDDADAILGTLSAPDVVTAALASPIPEGAAEPPSCPACGSTNFARTPKGLTFMALAATAIGAGVALDQTEAAFFIALIIGLALLFTPGSRCRDCETRW